jgi:hypothetical protein
LGEKEMKLKPTFIGLIIFILICNQVSAHVPYFEHKDFSEEKPFKVRKMITQSKAVYSWLENDGLNPCEDIDIYKFTLKKPSSMYIELIVPVVEEYYEEFVPWFALVGPGLPDPTQELPFDILEDHGAIVMENVEPGEPRETFYEVFGDKSYYEGPVFEGQLNITDTYYIYCWDPYKSGGDYTLVIGNLEIWGPLDILRALFYTPLIRRDFELHV